MRTYTVVHSFEFTWPLLSHDDLLREAALELSDHLSVMGAEPCSADQSVAVDYDAGVSHIRMTVHLDPAGFRDHRGDPAGVLRISLPHGVAEFYRRPDAASVPCPNCVPHRAAA